VRAAAAYALIGYGRPPDSRFAAAPGIASRKDGSMARKKRDFGALAKEIRTQLELSQEDLARELGVSYSTVNRWENGRYRPSKMARAQFDAFCKKMVKQGKLNLKERP